MVSVGLFSSDSRLYYVDKNYAVMDNPCDNFSPTIVRRLAGEPEAKEVAKILATLNMVLDGESFYRGDGLWCNKIKVNGAKNGKV